MTATLASEDTAAIHNLVALYFARVDRPGAALAADLFTADAELVLGTMRLRGRAAIATYFGERNLAQGRSGRLTRHLAGSVALSPIDGVRVAGTFTAVVFSGEGAPPLPVGSPSTVGDFDDLYVRVEEGWLFAHRSVSAVFLGCGAPAFARP